LLVLSVLLFAACNARNQLLLVNAGGLSVIVQPDSPLAYPGCQGECSDYHKAILLDGRHDYAEDVYAEPGSLVRIFSVDCVQLDSFMFTQSGALGQTAFQIDSTGLVSTVTQWNVGGDSAAGSVEHSPCPV